MNPGASTGEARQWTAEPVSGLPRLRQSSFVQLWRYLKSPHALLDACAREYGDVFGLELGPGKRWVVVHSPQLVKELFQADPEVFRAGAAKASMFAPLLGTTSSLVIDGAAHLDRRRLLLHAFGVDQTAAHTVPLRELCVSSMAGLPVGQPFAIHGWIKRVLFDSIMRGVFGEAGAAGSPLYRALETMTERAVNSKLLLVPWAQRDFGRKSPWGRFLATMRETDRAVFAEIERRRGSSERGLDLLSLLLDARDASGAGLSAQEIRDEALTMIVAGHEITGMSLAWAIANIAAHPHVQARVHGELDRVLGGAPLQHEHIARLEYLDATVRESLRKSSAVIVGSARRLAAPARVGGHPLEAGTMVVSSPHLLHHRADLYPEPNLFKPERFLGVRINPYEWIPFGGGTRRCLGMVFALHEIKVTLATLLTRYTVQLDGAPVRPERRGAFIAPSGGPSIRLQHRSTTTAPSHPETQS